MKRRKFLKRLGIGAVSTVFVSAVSVDAPVLAEPAQEATIGFSSTGILRTNEGVVNIILDEQKYWQNTTDVARNKLLRYNSEEL